MTETHDGALATFGGGCFWCVDAVFRQIEGVLDVVAGYSGGSVDAPSYKAVCAGTTGHAEVVQVRYDPARVAYATLLQVFWATHDPTTLNRQGNDVGTQYRSVIFAHDAAQRESAEALRTRLDQSQVYAAPIVTELVPFDRFWPAEPEHQDFYARNPRQPYCDAMIPPKLKKLAALFADHMKVT